MHELLGPGDGAQVSCGAEDLRLLEAAEEPRPEAEPLLPVDSPVDPRLGDRGDLGLPT